MKQKYQLKQLSLVIASLFIVATPAIYAADNDKTSSTDVGKITVEGKEGGQATGLIQPEETPKARSSVNRDYIEKQSSTTNPFQLLNLMPGVNTYDVDGTGLFGGTIRVRGFNSDQMGFTVNGAPVNDSGNFAVYPQEYTDSENLCEVFVTQGSADTEAPHVGASGGNIGMSICVPEDKRRFRLLDSTGSNSLNKYYARYDSGLVLNNSFKFFISYSKAQADKFKGAGHADREHTDFNSRINMDNGSYIDTALMYNKAINNNYLALTKNQINQYGWNYDYGTVRPVHQPAVNGTAQNDTTYAPNANIFSGQNLGYYDYSLNPFKNLIYTMNGHFVLTSKSAIDVLPYFWYGYGTGGNELKTLSEGTGSTQLGGGVQDINGDGDTKDKVFVYSGSVTKTYRPGVTAKFTQQLDDQKIMLGLWLERARHQQTAPYTTIQANGNPTDVWLDSSTDYITTANGAVLNNGRNTMTINTGKSVFGQDTISLLQDKLTVQVGGRYSSIKRDLTNNPSIGSPGYYEISKDYSAFLPSLGLRYQLSEADSIFTNIAKDFKAPSNSVLMSLMSGGTYVNGVYTGGTMRQPAVDKETSVNLDVGIRHTSDKWTSSATVFLTQFKNRIATAYDANENVNTDYNVGDSTSRGFELESGYALTKNWNVYGSLSYIKTHMDSNIQWTATAQLPTAGKELPDTPNWLSGLNIQYTDANWYVFTQAKYTGKRYTTLVNDDAIGGYTTVNLGGGYKFDTFAWVKNPTIKFNVNNLFDSKYLSLNSGSGSGFTTNATAVNGIAASLPSFYTSPPRTFSITLMADF